MECEESGGQGGELVRTNLCAVVFSPFAGAEPTPVKCLC